jgi:hypothetical protein
MIRAKPYLSQLGCFALLSTLFHPFFFLIFRLMAFNTVPRDDYAPYLLWLLHQPGGAFPGSPYGYRILSVLVAAPLYYLMPALPLTNLPADLAPAYLKATAALAAVSYLAMLAAAMMAYRLVVVRHARPAIRWRFCLPSARSTRSIASGSSPQSWRPRCCSTKRS